MFVPAQDHHEYQAHQRKIVRHFAPHMTNDALARQERLYFVLCLVRVVAVYLLPLATILSLHSWFIKTPVFAFVVIISLYELGTCMYRRFVLWPEGLRMRWNYWHEIELSEDCYKLKILGYYHRKIQKFLGRFPPSVSEESIQSYYRRRGIFLLSLFISAYLASTVLLFMSEKDANTRICVLYLLTVASGLVVMRFAKMHLIELPQVLALRERPEFAADFYPQATEKIPFARPVPAYQAVQPDQTPAVAVPTSASGIV